MWAVAFTACLVFLYFSCGCYTLLSTKVVPCACACASARMGALDGGPGNVIHTNGVMTCASARMGATNGALDWGAWQCDPRKWSHDVQTYVCCLMICGCHSVGQPHCYYQACCI